MEKLPISVAIIAHNSAHELAHSLGSVRDWVSEIVVVINDCSDDTAAVARSYGAVVHEHPWSNFRDQKNLALSYVTQEWVLCLDADEAISPELRSSIESFVRSPAKVPAAYFARRTWFLDRWITHGEWYPDHCLRLFKRGSPQWAGTEEHCQIRIPGAQLIHGDLLHLGFPDINTHVRKIAVFADAFVKQQTAKGRRWSLTDTLFRPWWRFFRSYFIKRGFLDGFPGLFIAVSTAFYTFVRYSRLYEHERRQPPS